MSPFIIQEHAFGFTGYFPQSSTSHIFLGVRQSVSEESLERETFPDLQVLKLQQCHGDRVLELGNATKRTDFDLRADGVVIKKDLWRDLLSDIVLSVRTADCLAILLEDSCSIALIHAGWRGLSAGIHFVARGNRVQLAFLGPPRATGCFVSGQENL